MAFSMAIGKLEGVARNKADLALRLWGGESVVLRFGVIRVLAKKAAWFVCDVPNRRIAPSAVFIGFDECFSDCGGFNGM